MGFIICNGKDMDAPWLVRGDFNVIWDEEEKFGGLLVSLNEIDDFRHCINTCNLFDLGFKGSIFTWWNGRVEEDCIFKRLDRCLANVEFQQKFPGIEVQHLSKTGSDHSPIFLKCDIETPPIKKHFNFLNFWVEHATFKDVVKENWSADFSANPFILFNHKLKKLKKALSLWSKATFGDIFQKIASMEEVVMVHEVEFEANPTGMNRERLHKVQAELIKCLALEEKYWQQKTGMTWFKEGDRNTKFFHAQIEEEQQIAEEAIKFYEEQFTEEATPSSFDIVEHVPNLINTEQNAELIKQPAKEEVKMAVLGLKGDSTGGQMVISRVVHERLVKFLPSLISEEQAGFVKGRNIVENILLTQEIVTDIRLRSKAGPNVILKLDITKAYNRISWLFLTKVLRKMGFPERLIGIVFGLVSNNWYSILINGQAHGFFKSSRGIKQGDPVSPTLFILAAEALSRGLNALHTNLYFCGFGMPKWSPKINHLVYADDMIIFSSSDETSLMLIMQVLKAYENASGQLVNKTKSVVYLHHLTDMEVVSKFFGSSTVGGTSRHWASWNTLCMPIEQGGIGFRSLHDVVKALFSLGALYFLVPHDFGIDENVHNVNDVTLDDLAVHIMEKIKPPSPTQVLDRPCWMLETRRYFSVKSAWQYTRRRDEPRTAYRMIWVTGLPFKISFFKWKVWKAKLPLDDFLKRIGYCMPSKCWCCVQPDKESFQHLFFRSETAKTTWKYFLSRAGIDVEGLTMHQAITKMLDCKCVLKAKTNNASTPLMHSLRTLEKKK
ncbi:uncharacterized protein LOC142175172 [Nicotiana tabacum]|uniref:Uncharacterized protein LOC142175172 n=1 Tax=Nicotiana tabacum TaxID=4097 RepID=A0AC58TKW7_TOBAC